MVHRPSDSRLLSNLLSHEKDYSKHLQSLLDTSHSSLASFSAFAAALSPPVSQVALSIAGDFSGADDALRGYKDAVDAWREQLKALKDMEEDVSNVVRDREILITRLLKASKNEKPPKDKASAPSRRSSVLSQHQQFVSSSSLSLSIDHSKYNPNPSLQTSSKLAAAQAELQACEAQLAQKERELEVCRVNAIRDGLRIRCHALIDCGWAWSEMGKTALRSLEGLPYGEGATLFSELTTELIPCTSSLPTIGDSRKFEPEAPQALRPMPLSAIPLHIQSEIESDVTQQPASEFSSISPSQSASQVNLNGDEPNTGHPPPIIPNAPNPILGINGSDIHPSSQHVLMDTGGSITPTPHIYRSSTPVLRPGSAPPPVILSNRPYSPYAIPHRRSSTSLSGVFVANGVIGEYEYNKIQIPPAHAISELTMPTVTTPSKPTTIPETASGYLTPISNEEKSRSESTLEVTRASGVRDGRDGNEQQQQRRERQRQRQRQGRLSRAVEEGSGAEDPTQDIDTDVSDREMLSEGKLHAVDNPRYQESGASTNPIPGSTPMHDGPVGQPVDGVVDGLETVPQEYARRESEPHAAVAMKDIPELEERSEHSDGEGPPLLTPVPTRGSQRQTPKKGGFLGGLKGLFTGHHRDKSSGDRGREKEAGRAREREEKEREREEKEREREERKEEKAREKEEKREEKAREREEKAREREGKAREREERRDEKLHEREDKARLKRQQKQARGRERQVKVLTHTAGSSDEENGPLSDDDVFSGEPSGGAGGGGGLFGWGRKSHEGWATRTDRNITDIRKESARAGDQVEGVVDGFVVKRNASLQKNLRGIVVGRHASPLDLRTGKGRGYHATSIAAGGSSPSLVNVGSSSTDTPAGRKLQKRHGGPSRARANTDVGTRGAPRGTSPNVPFPGPVASTSALSPEEKATITTTSTKATATGLVFPPPPITHPVRAVLYGTETRFTEEISPNQSPAQLSSIKASKRREGETRDGYASDTTGFASSSRAPAATTVPSSRTPTSGPAGVPAAEAKLPRRKRSHSLQMGEVIGTEAGLERHKSVLSSHTAPAGMSTGLGGTGSVRGGVGRKGSVGVSVAAPNRRAASLDYGRQAAPVSRSPQRKVTIPPAGVAGSSSTQTQQMPQESLMSIVDSLTKSNRQAWDAGMVESKIDRTRGSMKSEVGSKFLGPVVPIATGTKTGGRVDAAGSRMKADNVERKVGGVMSDVVRAPPRLDRQALLTSLQEVPSPSGKVHPNTTAGTRTQVNGTPAEKKPLKSAMRTSRSPSPMAATTQRSRMVNGTGVDKDRVSASGPGAGTGKAEAAAMEWLPSLSSLPVEERKPDGIHPSVRSADNANGARSEQEDDSDDDDSASTSSYETGPENFQDSDEEKKQNNGVGAGLTPTATQEHGRPNFGSHPLATSTPVRGDRLRDTTPSADRVGQVAANAPTSQPTNSTPQRRKSVRVSLQPTYSPAPVIEDDGEDEEATRAATLPRQERERSVHRRRVDEQSAVQAPRASVTQRGGEKPNIWDVDNSDEDVEYQKTKRMLARATRKGNELLR